METMGITEWLDWLVSPIIVTGFSLRKLLLLSINFSFIVKLKLDARITILNY